MTTYIAILRGINVGGRKLIKMESLRALFGKLGFDHVSSYIQSGNIAFSAEAEDLRKLVSRISNGIQNEYGFTVPVIVLSEKTLASIIENNPFLNENDKDVNFMHVTFLSEKPVDYDWNTVESKAQMGEEIKLIDSAVYLYCPLGYGETKLHNKLLENKLKVNATTRNWKTSLVLLSMLGKDSQD